MSEYEDVTDARLNTVPVFKGEKLLYPDWKRTFESVAEYRGCAEALLATHEASMPETFETVLEDDAAGKLLKAAVNKNKMAMAMLNIGLKGKAMGLLVTGSYTPAWPRGRAWVVMAALERRFNPKGLSKTVNYTNEVAAVTMKAKENPSNLIDTLQDIKVRYTQLGCTVQEENLVAQALLVAPDSYASALLNLQREKANAKEDVKLEDVREVMEMLYDLTLGEAAKKASANSEAEEKKEVSLSQYDKKKGKGSGDGSGNEKFKGRCFNCGKIGHRKAECTAPKRKGSADPPNNPPKAESGNNCTLCGVKGHTENKCWMKEGNTVPASAIKVLQRKIKDLSAAAINVDREEKDMLCQHIDGKKVSFPKTMGLLNDPTIWIADSACTAHSTCHKNGMIELSKPNDGAVFIQPNGSELKHEATGKIPVTACDQYGETLQNFTLTNVKYVKEQKFNLFSTSRIVMDGWKPSGGKDALIFEKGEHKLIFDIKIPTASSCLFAICLKRRLIDDAAMAEVTKMTVMQAHQKLGHINEDMTRKVAKSLGWELTKGSLGVCEACSVGKAKQKNVPKESEHKTVATRPNQRIFLDLASVRAMEGMPKPTKPQWRITVDEYTGYKTSGFYVTKDAMVAPMCAYMNEQKLKERPIDIIRCDNAGENNLLQKTAKGPNWKLKVDFEYTARDTPQQNHLAELGFATLASKGRAMMYAANLPLEIRFRLYREAFQTATLLDGLQPVEINGVTKSRYNHWSNGSEPKWAKYLRTWGEAGTVKLTSLATGKLEDRGVPCIFVGYATDHDGDVYRMWDPRTGRVHETRDIIWLRRMFYTKKEGATNADFDIVVPTPVYTDGPAVPNLGAGEGGNMDITNAPTAEAAEEAPTAEAAEEAPAAEVTEEATAHVTVTQEAKGVTTTRSGRNVRVPARFREDDVAALNEDGGIELLPSEVRYIEAMREIHDLSLQNIEVSEIYPADTSFVGMGIGGGFDNTAELHVLKYNEAMNSDDCLEVGPEKELITSKLEFMMVFNCDDQGVMQEYIGCKVERQSGSIKIMQPVLLQSFKDEFGAEASDKVGTPAIPGKVLTQGDPDLTTYQQFTYRSGTGKLIHLSKWSRPDILNAVRELARYMSTPTTKHVDAMMRCMSYVLNTPKRGLVLKPNVDWGGRYHVFVITGRSDSNFAACPDTRRSVIGYTVFVHMAPTENKSNMLNWVVLSVTEAELAAATSCAQSMLFHYRILISMGFKVQLPMILEVDNKGAKDVSNNWSVGGRLRHIDVRQFFLRDLKEDGMIVLKWISTDNNSTDMFTKNLHGPAFEKDATVLVGKDEYMQ